jgi:hypothetical protein
VRIKAASENTHSDQGNALVPPQGIPAPERGENIGLDKEV